MNRIYEKLMDNKDFNGKLKLDETKKCLNIVFNEYLRLDYFEGNYTSAKDEGTILLNNSLNHWHIQDDEEALEIITALANGEVIYIEDTSFFTFVKLRVLEKTKFEKKKEKYMSKNSLRIYTGNEIIKRSIK